MNPVVETYETKPEDFLTTDEQKDAYLRVLLDAKGQLAAGQVPVTDRCRTLAAEYKQLRFRAAVSQKGWTWHARIVDGRANKVLYDSGMAYRTRDKADRHGQRLIARWRETGSFEKAD
jgi:hypothetical protein